MEIGNFCCVVPLSWPLLQQFDYYWNIVFPWFVMGKMEIGKFFAV